MLLVSDIHIGVHEEPLLDALLAAAAQDPDKVVVISGDLTQDSLADEFERVTRLLDDLIKAGVAVSVTPGNHDFGSQLLNFKTRLHFLSSNYTTAAQRLSAALAPAHAQVQPGCTLFAEGYDSILRVPSGDVFVALNTQHRAGARVKESQIEWATPLLQQLLAQDSSTG